MNAKLVAVDGISGVEEVLLTSLPIVLGRNPAASVHLEDRFVSRRHCQIDEWQGALRVRDLESRHGTYVNGKRVHVAELQPGDILSIGMTTLRAEYEPGSLEALVTIDGNSFSSAE